MGVARTSFFKTERGHSSSGRDAARRSCSAASRSRRSSSSFASPHAHCPFSSSSTTSPVGEEDVPGSDVPVPVPGTARRGPRRISRARRLGAFGFCRRAAPRSARDARDVRSRRHQMDDRRARRHATPKSPKIDDSFPCRRGRTGRFPGGAGRDEGAGRRRGAGGAWTPGNETRERVGASAALSKVIGRDGRRARASRVVEEASPTVHERRMENLARDRRGTEMAR